jgi:predicted nucleotidyltransferase
MSQDVLAIRQLLRRRQRAHHSVLVQEASRLASDAAALGAQRVVLIGSLARGNPGLTSDLDLLIVWDTPLDFVTRAVELYRRLRPRVPVDLLVYTPAEMTRMIHRPFVRQALQGGKVLYEA